MSGRDFAPRGLTFERLGGLEIVVGTYRDLSLPRHSHDGLMLSLLDAGVQVLECRGSSHAAGAGAVLAVPPHEVHAAEPGSELGWRYQTVTIPTETIRQHSNGRTEFCCDTLISDDRLNFLLCRLFRKIWIASILAQEEALAELLAYFLARYAKLSLKAPHKMTELRAVETCKAYLAGRLDQNVSLVDLAREARMDRFQLVRAFSRIVGMPPHEWHVQQRIHRCVELLGKGQSVADVAANTGFADQAHLTRMFKRIRGITPGQYRKDNIAFQMQRLDLPVFHR